MTTQPLPHNINSSSLPQPGQTPEIPDIPPATVPEQEPDSLPEPLGPEIPDRPEHAPDVSVPEHSPEIPPATVPGQQPDSLPEPPGPEIPDRPDQAPDVPTPECRPRTLSNQKNLRCNRTRTSFSSRFS